MSPIEKSVVVVVVSDFVGMERNMNKIAAADEMNTEKVVEAGVSLALLGVPSGSFDAGSRVVLKSGSTM